MTPAVPHYLLHSPNGEKRPFPDSTSSFGNAFDGFVELGPGMSIKLEKAFFVPAASRQLRDYRGLESAQYLYHSAGALRLTSHAPLPDRPNDQAAVDSVLSANQLALRYHRFFFQIVMSKLSGTARAVLLSTNSTATMTSVAANLLRGDGCPPLPQQNLFCTPIPEPISASLSFEVIANSKTLTVPWGTTVAGVIGAQKPLKLLRNFRGKKLPVDFPPADSNALRLPLWPGDVLTF